MDDNGDGEARPGAVLLAAGRGSRLSELTDSTHKSLLMVGGQPALGRVIEALTAADVHNIVVVTGYRADDLRTFIGESHSTGSVSFAHNPAWATDTNILSTEIGVSALEDPAAGYLIVETDVALDPAGWEHVCSTMGGKDSTWFTKGTYGADLTGGCLAADDSHTVTDICYAPNYDPALEGWHKLLGLLYVAPRQVSADRQWRRAAIERSTMQYYMQPYVDHLAELPCTFSDLGDSFAMSFNDLDAYNTATESLSEGGH